MKEAPLGSICDINPRRTAGLNSEIQCSFIPMEYIDDHFGIVTKKSVRQLKEVEKGYTSFQDNDVLFAKITPCMENGKCAIAKSLVNGIGFGSTEFHVIRVQGTIISEWVYYYLRQESIRKKAELNMTGSAGQKRVPSSFLEEILIPLPPLSEQRRIASILEKADRLRRQRHYALELSSTYLQSVFLEMFGDPVTNPKGWNRVPISELGIVQTGNTPSRDVPKNYGDYIEWIKSDNIVEGLLYITKSKEQLSELGARQGRIIEPMSLLITCIAGSPTTIGNVALTNRRVAFNQQINAITPNNEINPFFLYGMFLVAKPLIQHSTTLGMKRIITKSKLENLYLVKPPKELQKKFATIVQCIERIRAQQREAECQAEHLFQTLLHQAFQGNVGLGSGIAQGEDVEDSVQASVVDSQLTGRFVQLRMKY